MQALLQLLMLLQLGLSYQKKAIKADSSHIETERLEQEFPNQDLLNNIELRILQSSHQCLVGYTCFNGECMNNVCSCFKGYSGVECEYELGCNGNSDNCGYHQEQNGLIIAICIGIPLILLFMFFGYICFCKKSNPQSFEQCSEQSISIELPPLKITNVYLRQRESNLQSSKLSNKVYQLQIENCSICLDTIDVFQRFEINCTLNHVFHKDCIRQWLLSHKTCPQCSGAINIK